MRFLILVIAAFVAFSPARADQAAWRPADVPGARVAAGEGRTAFLIDGEGALILFDPAPLAGRTFDQAAKDFVAASLGGKEVASRDEADVPTDGEAEARLVTVATVGGQLRAYHLRRSGETFGAAVLVLPGNGRSPALMAALREARLASEAPPAPAGTGGALAFGEVASSTLGYDFARATANGIDPEVRLLPDRFACFHGRERAAFDVRAGRLTIEPGGGYAHELDGQTRRGTYAFLPGEEAYRFDGPVTASRDDVSVRTDIFGQSIQVEVDGDLAYCHQEGPAADDVRLRFLRALPSEASLRCAGPDGAPVTVDFAPTTYRTPDGAGSVTARGRWTGSRWDVDLSLSDGPWDGADLAWTEHEDGRLEASASLYQSFRTSAFSVGSKRTPLALCRGRGPARPSALYGSGAAPPGAAKDRAEGWFGRTRMGMTFASGVGGYLYSLPTMEIDYFGFQSDGYVREADAGPDPDACKRTRPNGWPVCLRYETDGRRVRIEETPGKWEDEWSQFGDGDGPTFFEIAPMTGYRVDAVYTHQSAMSSGGGAFDAAAASVFWSGRFKLNEDGRYEWWRGTRSSVAIGGGAAGGAIGGGGGSDAETERGRYAVDGNWLTLTADDGGTTRVFVHQFGDGWRRGDPPLDYLDLGGRQYSLRGPDD